MQIWWGSGSICLMKIKTRGGSSCRHWLGACRRWQGTSAWALASLEESDQRWRLSRLRGSSISIWDQRWGDGVDEVVGWWQGRHWVTKGSRRGRQGLKMRLGFCRRGRREVVGEFDSNSGCRRVCYWRCWQSKAKVMAKQKSRMKSRSARR